MRPEAHTLYLVQYLWEGEWTDTCDYHEKLEHAQEDAKWGFPDCYTTRIAQRDVGPIVPI